MRKLVILVALLITFVSLSAHPWKPKYYVIVDTDCGFDDLRALCLMLASPEIRVVAVTTSNGVLDARTGFLKLKSLMYELHHEGILIGASPDTVVNPVRCVPAENLQWGKPLPDTAVIPQALDVVNYVFNNLNEPITFVNLGSLNTVAACLEKCHLFQQRVNNIIWSSGHDFTDENFNYSLDTIAAKKVMESNTTFFHLINGEYGAPFYTQPVSDQLSSIEGPIASIISSSIVYPDTRFSKAVFDELTLVFMHFSEMFVHDTVNTMIRHSLKPNISSHEIMQAFKQILYGETVNQNQVLSVFPTDTSSYFPDLQNVMMNTVKLYGMEEWTANTIAGELHRHLGVYAVIGVKMGIRVKDYFGAGIDEMGVISFAGTTPPYSCLNDGIQVSTGATLGHGLIQIGSEILQLPSAEFTYMNRKIAVSLREEYRVRIEQEISEYNRIYGLNSNIYWELVRQAAIKYWVSWERNDIFEIKVIE